MNWDIQTIILLVVAALVAFFVVTNLAKIKKFIGEVSVELKKVSWSTRKELIDATWIVIVSSILLGLFIGVTDFTLSKMLEIIIG